MGCPNLEVGPLLIIGGPEVGKIMASPDQKTLELADRSRLVSLLTCHQQRILAYIHALVPDPHDAQDVLQQTCLVICEKFHEFDPESDFVAWARQIAWWQVRAVRQKFARSKVLFDDDVLGAIAETAGTEGSDPDRRLDALSRCLERLLPRDRDLVLARYERGGDVEHAAQRSGRSLQAAYKALARIRRLLFDCVASNVADQGAL
jgi:RNA polymerase sigma-70 factor (ECF subfamily)